MSVCSQAWIVLVGIGTIGPGLTTLVQVEVGHYSLQSNGKEPLGDPLCNNDLVGDVIYV